MPLTTPNRPSSPSPPAPSTSLPKSSSIPFNLTSLFSTTTPTNILSNLAPSLLHPRILSSPHFILPAPTVPGSNEVKRWTDGFGNLLSANLGEGGRRLEGNRESTMVYIKEAVGELLALPVDVGRDEGDEGRSGKEGTQIPLIVGFNATRPLSISSRLERRRRRSGMVEEALGGGGAGGLGLRDRALRERGLLEEGEKEGLGIGRPKALGEGRESIGAKARRKSGRVKEVVDREWDDEKAQGEQAEIRADLQNLRVRRALFNGEIEQVTKKINKLEEVRDSLKSGLLGLREEELELEDELEGLQERISTQSELKKGRTVSSSSRRRKGPAFLPSEHDELPSGIAFMTLTGHLAPITSLDFSEPYGVAVTSSLDDSVRLWDLTTGDQLGFLQGHTGPVKALQVEASLCVTGGADGHLRIWDLDLVEQSPLSALPESVASSSRNREGSVGLNENGMMREEGESGDGTGQGPAPSLDGPCVRTLDGHSKAVTSLYFDGTCLVTGSSDRTLRQWDLETGQCVLTMDILWAISHPLASQTLSSSTSSSNFDDLPFIPSSSSSPRSSLGGGMRRQSGEASFLPMPMPELGLGEMYDDFVGGVQFWGYALASGTGDGCVRMWDMRTGQAHRTLVGHTGPVTCVQFDEFNLISGSLDKSIRVWDLRTGSISQTIRYENPVTGLQFDSRKIVAAAGESGVRLFNRTTFQHSTLSINGHTSPVERLRFMDRYLATGSRDHTVKIWALP